MNTISGWIIRPIGPQDSGSGISDSWSPSYTAQFAFSRNLHSIGDLDDNWDGYGAARVHASTVVLANVLIEMLEHGPDCVAASVTGTIVFEWEGPLGSANLELGKETYSFYTSPHIGRPIFLGGVLTTLNAQQIDYALGTVKGVSAPRSITVDY
jgi:hypothetical protein